MVFSRKLTRLRVLAFSASVPRCVVAMEACASAHFWGREIRRLGHGNCPRARSAVAAAAGGLACTDTERGRRYLRTDQARNAVLREGASGRSRACRRLVPRCKSRGSAKLIRSFVDKDLKCRRPSMRRRPATTNSRPESHTAAIGALGQPYFRRQTHVSRVNRRKLRARATNPRSGADLVRRGANKGGCGPV